MSKTNPIIISLILCIIAMLTSCSQNDEEPNKKSAIEQFTSKTAQDMVHRIQSPIEKAKQVKLDQEKRNKLLDNANATN